MNKILTSSYKNCVKNTTGGDGGLKGHYITCVAEVFKKGFYDRPFSFP